jgi:hypothetical protein
MNLEWLGTAVTTELREKGMTSPGIFKSSEMTGDARFLWHICGRGL